jgi:hypothetical protein
MRISGKIECPHPQGPEVQKECMEGTERDAFDGQKRKKYLAPAISGNLKRPCTVGTRGMGENGPFFCGIVMGQSVA